MPHADVDDTIGSKKRRIKDAKTGSSELDEVMGAITVTKEKVENICSVSQGMPIPKGMKFLLHDACLESPIKPPIIAPKCCESLIGCESCVDN